MDETTDKSHATWQLSLREVIFEADTPAGKVFDVGLLICIVCSVLTVMLESVTAFRQEYGDALRIAEWVFTGLFTIEYALRLLTFGHRRGYAVSFFGVVDLLAILPTYLSLFVGGAQSLVVIRSLRLLRIFRVLKLVQFLGEARMLQAALKGEQPQDRRLPGCGDDSRPHHRLLHVPHRRGGEQVRQYSPQHLLGHRDPDHGGLRRYCAADGAGPRAGLFRDDNRIWHHRRAHGIVTSELASLWRQTASTRVCGECAQEGHDLDSRFCKHCGCELADRRQRRSGLYRGPERRKGER